MLKNFKKLKKYFLSRSLIVANCPSNHLFFIKNPFYCPTYVRTQKFQSLNTIQLSRSSFNGSWFLKYVNSGRFSTQPGLELALFTIFVFLSILLFGGHLKIVSCLENVFKVIRSIQGRVQKAADHRRTNRTKFTQAILHYGQFTYRSYRSSLQYM